MKKLILILSLAVSFGASAEDAFNCTYAKANVTNGNMGPMIIGGPSKVLIINEAMKAFRPNGTYLYSPPIKEDKGATWMISDGGKFYAISKDFTNFAITDKIARTTEQWTNCTLERNSGAVESKQDKPDAWKKRNLSQSEQRFVENAIKDKLKDPDSAKFKHSKYVSNGKGAYCGMVNSKNSYGGYVGDSPFMALIMHDKKGNATGAGAISVGGDSDEMKATYLTCQDNGYF